MKDAEKRGFFLSHKRSSALVVSVAIHGIFLIAALSFVAVNVIIKNDQTFEVKEVKRPNMKLRKLQVPVKEQKKTQAPKLRKTIVAKPKNPTVDIKMPEIVGVKGGTGYGRSGGLGGLGFSFDMDLFGGSRGTGNEFIGNFYDLKQTPGGRPTEIGKQAAIDLTNSDQYNRSTALLACKTLNTFISSGWNENRLSGFFKAPKQKFATTFMMPPMGADEAPVAFGVEDQVKPSYWVCHYKGSIAAPETGRYRFCGHADDILVVGIGKKVVLDASYPDLIKKVTSWKSRDENNRKFPLDIYGKTDGMDFLDVFSQIEKAGGYDGDVPFFEAYAQIQVDGKPISTDTRSYETATSRMVIGDWISLTKGKTVPVEILIGEIPGGGFRCRLLIEQEGKEYKMVQSDGGLRPVLPVFKTTAVDDEDLIKKMNLKLDQMTLDGPAFGVLVNKPTTEPF
jgi:hypothetical protein